LQTSKQVKTSIVILTHNKLDYTRACIGSIRKFTEPGTYEIIVVDNLSTDGTREWLAEQTDILTIFNEENVGFPRGCNQGMEFARGDAILLLNNDTVVTPGWLALLTECLFSDETIGAVGPVSNSAYQYQDIPVSYQTVDEMLEFASRYNVSDPQSWHDVIKLIGFCLLIKREAVERIGKLDERFSPGMCEDADYCMRLIQAGYRLKLCTKVFVHHFGSISFGEISDGQRKLLADSRKKFVEKWGFHTVHHMAKRSDMVELIDEPNFQRSIRVLDVGCACGATLLEVKNRYPNAELYGVEKNPHAAAIASAFAQVRTGDAEAELDYPEHFFDVILLGHVVEQLRHPDRFLEKCRSLLAPNGKVILSVFNVSHIHVLQKLSLGNGVYAEGGALDPHNVRWYDRAGIQTLLTREGFEPAKWYAENTFLSEADEAWIAALSKLKGGGDTSSHRVWRYVVRAEPLPNSSTLRNESVMNPAAMETRIMKDSEMKTELDAMFRNARETGAFGRLSETIAQWIKDGKCGTDAVIQAVHTFATDKQDLLNKIAAACYRQQLYDDMIPFLHASLQIDPTHTDTLYNFAFILHRAGSDEQALQFLHHIREKDEEALRLKEKIQQRIAERQK
jgi:GT2 family glycosyltransferase/tetratricopeptide (TPR) repeat protein